MTDIGTVLTASLDRSGNGGMLSAFKSVDGAVGGPGLAFANEPTTGFYRYAANSVGFAVGGTLKYSCTASAFNFNGIGVTVTSGTLTVLGNTYLSSLTGISATLQVTGSSTTGVSATYGTEIFNTGSIGGIQSYNRSSSVFLPMEVSGSTLSLQIGGGTYALTAGANGNWSLSASNGGSTLTAFAAAAGTPLTLQGGDSNYCLRLLNYGATSGAELIVPTGSNSGLIIGSDAGPIYLHDGTGIYSTGATGGAKGAGTANFAGLYINGSALYVGVPLNTQTGSTYTLVATDAGKAVYSSYSGATTFTIPQSVLPTPSVVTFINDASGNLSITPATGVTLTLAGTTTTGTRTLAANGMATAYQVTTNAWLISGSGLS